MCCLQVDRLFDWQAHPNAPIQETLELQKPNVRLQFQKQLDLAVLNLNEQGARARQCCLPGQLHMRTAWESTVGAPWAAAGCAATSPLPGPTAATATLSGQLLAQACSGTALTASRPTGWPPALPRPL